MRQRLISGSAVFRLASIASVLAIALGFFLWFPADDPTPVRAVPGGDAVRGRDALRSYGCVACHSVPGVQAPDSYVGPPLDHWAQRRYIAGRVPNELDVLIEWIQFPQAIDPETAMPVLGVTEEDARDIAAYLYSLE